MDPEKDVRMYSSGMMASVPVIRGTRVSLWTLMEYLQDDRGLEAFLADHPQVTRAQVQRTLLSGLQALVDRRQEVHEPGGRPSGESASPGPAPSRDSGEI